MNDYNTLYDEFGPEKIIHIYDPQVELKAVLVVDNVAVGPSIGGIRMVPDISVEECFRLARAMTFKNSAAGLPHGGGKSMIAGDPAMPLNKKETLLRAFARAIADIKDYIPGPDMGTNEICMAWIRDEIGRSVGLPKDIGGIPLDKIGATAFGLRAALDVAKDYANISLAGAKVVIQGFGSVGKHSARFLSERSSLVVAVSDSKGAIYNPEGLDVEELIKVKENSGKVTDYQNGQVIDGDSLISVDCDIWIPAARPDVIHKENMIDLKAKIVAPGANIPMPLELEEVFYKKGIMVLPDFIVNAGGVICAAVEYAGGTMKGALETIEERVSQNTKEVLESSRVNKISPHEAAMNIVRERVLNAMSFRRKC